MLREDSILPMPLRLVSAIIMYSKCTNRESASKSLEVFSDYIFVYINIQMLPSYQSLKHKDAL